MKLKETFTSIIFLLGLGLYAQDNVSIQYPVAEIDLHGYTSFSPGPPIVLTIAQNPDISNQNYKVKKANLFISLTIDDDGLHKMGDALELAEVEFELTENFLATSPISQNLTLSLTASLAESVYLYEFTDELIVGSIESFELEDVILNTPTISSTYSSDDAVLKDYVKEHIRLRMWFEIEYGIDVHQPSPSLLSCEPLSITQKVGPITPPLTTPGDVVNRVQTFEWTSIQGYDFPGYEFQLLKLENINSTIPAEFKAIVDWTKALTVETYSSETQLTLTIGQGSGYYIWRVRPIGNFYEGGIADSRNWGKWSTGSFNNYVEVSLTGTNHTYIQTCFKFVDPDDDISWIYSRVFTEDGNVGEGITYANGLLQPVQTQAYSSSTGTVITAQTLYDFTGRPSMSTIPVPSPWETPEKLEGYKDGFVLSGLNLYTAEDFDDDAKIQSPEQIEQTNSSFNYYSETNPDEFIPDAEGYPFVRTIFMNDGSGRPIEQSGVGKVHAIGEITNGSTHTTKVYYGTPSNEELIAIFGDEAPLADKVVKTSTVDPNGTINIIYTTIEGKTIATAMTYVHATNLVEIDPDSEFDEQLDIAANFETVVNTMDNNMFVSSKIIVLPKPTVIELSYSIDCITLENTCGTPDCDYKIKFRIVNEITGEYFETNDFGVTCGADMEFTGITWTPTLACTLETEDVCKIDLPAGYWKVQKVVWSAIDPDAISNNGPLSKLEPLMQVVSGWMEQVTNNDQFNDFINLLEDFNDEIEAAHIAAEGACAPNFIDLSSCYQSHSLFEAIRDEYGLGEFYIFDPEYTLELPTNGSGQQYISFTAGCCNSIDVDIPGLEKHVLCHKVDSLINEDDLNATDVLFSQIFKEFFYELVDDAVFETTDMDDEWELAMPGYGTLVEVTPSSGVYTSDLDQMVYHMLTDQYYIGKADYVSSEWVTWETKDEGTPTPVYPIPTLASQELYGPHYSCSDIYDCWYASMRAYYEINSMQGQTLNIYDMINDELDPLGTGDPAGDHYDDPESADPDPGFLNWLVEMIISHKMKKFSDELAGDITGDNDNEDPQFALQINIPNLFLGCTGKKIAAIVSPEIADELNYDIYDTDNYAADPNEIVLATDENDDELIPDQLTYPYILKPIWAFKYFEYIPGIEVSGITPTASSETPNPLLPAIPTVEINSCYHDFSSVNFCGANPCPDDHHSWSADEREAFYESIKYTKEDTDFAEEMEFVVPECPTSMELEELRDAKINKAYDACETRRAEFKMGIEYMLLENCYVLVPCNDDTETNYVSQAEIEIITDNVVESCSLYVDNIIVECEDGFIPTCDDESCVFWDPTSGTFVTSVDINIVLFNPAKITEEKLYFVQHGNFIPALDPADSKCITPPTSPDWYLNAEIEPDCPDEILTPILVESE